MSLRDEMERHPERFPNGTWKKAEPGRSWLIFLKQIPKASSKSLEEARARHEAEGVARQDQ
jgi:hypothetical protein